MRRSIPFALTAAAFGLTALLAPVACSAERATASDTWSRSYAIASGGHFSLVNVNGPIRAEASAGASLELVGERIARASSEANARELLERTEMRERVADGDAGVEVIPATRLPRADLEVSWTVRVPAGVRVDLETTNGRITLRGLTGELRAETVNGEIEAGAIAATLVSAETVNGSIDVELTTPLASGGRVELEAVNGSVSLALPEASHATVSAAVLNGSVDAGDLALAKSGGSSRRALRGTLGGGGARVRLETVNGSAHLSKSGSGGSRAPAAAAAALAAR